MKTVIILIGIMLICARVDAACTTVAAETAQICCASTAGDNVATCGTTVAGDNTPAATCKAGFKWENVTPTAGTTTTAIKGCVACGATQYAATSTSATCTSCSAKCCILNGTTFATVQSSSNIKTCATVTTGSIGDAVNASACNAGYKLDNGACVACTGTNQYTASDVATTCTACNNNKCCIKDGAFATVKSHTGITTCATVTSGAIGTAVDATVCDNTNGYTLSGGACTRPACRATATDAEYRADGGKKCCFAAAARTAAGVASCVTPVPTTAGTEYNAATCSTGYTLVNGECILDKCRASQTQDAYRTEGGKKCCWLSSTSKLLGSNVATCGTEPTAIGEYPAATCAAGYSVVNGECIQDKCRTGQTETAYQNEGAMKCCWLSSTSTIKGTGVATCSATVPTALGEFDALTCSAGYYLSSGTCKPLCAATTTDADYVVNGKQCCYATATLNAIKGAGVATCATAPTAVGEYLAATCSAGYLLTAGVCEKICSPTTADAAAYANNGGAKCCSKDKDNNFKGKGVNTCTAVDPTQFTATAEVNALGCDANYYLSSGACMACGADKFSAVNSTTADACQAKDKAPAGTIYDETTKSFLRCAAPCATCAGSVTKCASCIVNVPDFKEPASGDANYETLLKTYQFDNATATCLSSCAEGFKLQDIQTRAKCIESSTSGLFAIILSVFSIFISLL